MGRGFYQEELSGSVPGLAQALPDPSRPAEDGGAPGRGLAVVLHLLLIIGGPVGVALSILIPLLLARDTRPLVAGTADAILRFVAQLGVLGVVGFALLASGHEQLAVAPLVVMAGALLTLPLLAAWRTWRTGQVFRYPLWDLLRPRRQPILSA